MLDGRTFLRLLRKSTKRAFLYKLHTSICDFSFLFLFRFKIIIILIFFFFLCVASLNVCLFIYLIFFSILFVKREVYIPLFRWHTLPECSLPGFYSFPTLSSSSSPRSLFLCYPIIVAKMAASTRILSAEEKKSRAELFRDEVDE
mgnify:CR=1 FL=1